MLLLFSQSLLLYHNSCPQEPMYTNPSRHGGFPQNVMWVFCKNAVEIVNRRTRTRLRAPHSIEKAKTVVHFLRENGFEDAHIRKIVTNYPKFLIRDVEKTLIPKIKVLQDLGLTGSRTGELMSRSPTISWQPLSRTIEFPDDYQAYLKTVGYAIQSKK